LNLRSRVDADIKPTAGFVADRPEFEGRVKRASLRHDCSLTGGV